MRKEPGRPVLARRALKQSWTLANAAISAGEGNAEARAGPKPATGVPSEDTLSYSDYRAGGRKEHMAWLNSLRLKSKDAKVRRKALESLDADGCERRMELLAASLRDDEVDVRRAAVGAVEKSRHAQALDLLAAALGDFSAEVREVAAVSLGRRGDARGTEYLTCQLKDPKAKVRLSAAAALRNLGWKPATSEEQALFDVSTGNSPKVAIAAQAAVKALVSDLTHDTSFHRRAAAEALENVDDPRAIGPLLTAADDEDATVRVSAIHALAKAATGPVAGKLLKLFGDRDARVRLAAAQVLAKQSDPFLGPNFLGLLNDENFEVRQRPCCLCWPTPTATCGKQWRGHWARLAVRGPSRR
jgi:HEAT repeat protein